MMNEQQDGVLEIGPYIRRTKLFDDFYGIYKNSGRKVIVRIFSITYNLSKTTINRIKSVHKKLENSAYVQKLIASKTDNDTAIQSLIFIFYPKISFSLLQESNEYYTKFIPAFIYKGILCLQELRNNEICHHDICLENVYFGNPVDNIKDNDDISDLNNGNKKDINQDPLKFDFKLLNWTFATIGDEKHIISITSRYQYTEKTLCDVLLKDPYKHDLWDFAITVLSLFNEEEIPELLHQINNGFKMQWIPFLKKYHQYPEHCKKVKEFFEKVFNIKNPSQTILLNLIFSDIFTLDFL